MRSTLPPVLDSVDETVALLAPPVRAVGVGGALAALALVGAWAGLRARRREGELRALVARGLSPARAAGGVVVEAALPVLVGVAAGVGLGLLAVRLLGRGRSVPLDTPTLLWAAGAGLAALLTVAAVTWTAVARHGRTNAGPAAQLLGRVPLVPVLAAVTVAAAVTAVLPRLPARLRPGVERWTPAPLLAVRRVLGAAGAARLVVVVVALSLALVTLAASLGASTDRTLDVKAVVASGSEVVVRLQDRVADPVPPAGTMLVRVDTGVDLLPGEVTSNLQAIDPTTFPAVGCWNDKLSAQSLPDLMRALTDYRGDRVPVLIAGPVPTAVLQADGGA